MSFQRMTNWHVRSVDEIAVSLDENGLILLNTARFLKEAAARLLSDPINALDTADTLIAGSFVGDEAKERLKQILGENKNVVKG